MEKINVAIIQHTPVFLNLQASMDAALEYIGRAASEGAQIIVFPESWLPGYPVWLDYAPEAGLWNHEGARALYRILTANSLSISDDHYQRLKSASREMGVFIVMGGHERVGSRLYISMLFLSPDGSDCGVHRKLMPTYTERLIWGQGDGSTLHSVETPFGPMSGLICWEHWMPLARAAIHEKRETIHVAQWPAVKDLHQVASRHYAFEGQCYVLAAGCVLSKDQVLAGFDSQPDKSPAARALLETMPEGNLLNGCSAIYAPDGECLSGPHSDIETIIHCELHSNAITEGRLFLDTSGHYSRPDIFSLEVDTRVQQSVVFKDGTP